MRKIVWILAALALLSAITWLAIWWLRPPPWTTSSPAALAAFQKGLEAQRRLYHADAMAAFSKALESDPQFVAAKLRLLDETRDKAAREKLLAEIKSADRARLNDREQFLLDNTLARLAGDRARVQEVVSAYLARHPRDAWGLLVAGSDAWAHLDFARAEEYYQRLLEVDPNWVLGRNSLGYIAFAQGRFEEAEEQFRTYRFMAPDQANPHDSLGELLVLRGRYEEAQSELEQALAMRPDFCASYNNLLTLALLEGEVDAAAAVVERARPHCPAEQVTQLSCVVQLFRALFARAYAAGLDEVDPLCQQGGAAIHPMRQRLALLAGRREPALAIEEAWRERAAKAATEGRDNDGPAIHAFLVGIRLLAERKEAEALERLRDADEKSLYWGNGGGLFKLSVRLTQAIALERAGDREGAAERVAQVRAVNPRYADRLAWLAEHTP